MNIEKKPGLAGINAKLILSLEENGFYRDYYQVFNSTGLYLFLLDEFGASWKQDYFTIYFNWKNLIKNLDCCESNSWLPIKNKWWSYCPQWLYFNPVFIENDFRPLFNNELCKSLDGIFETDLSEAEKFRFKIWMKACEPQTYQLNLFT
jgi:hypothetical protein